MISAVVLRDGRQVTLRRALAEDRPAILELYAQLSDRSRHQRFFHPTPRLNSALRELLTDLDRGEVWLAFAGTTCVGEARITPFADHDRADLAVTVADGYQNAGLGRHLTRAALTDTQRRREEITISILPENAAAVRLARNGHVALRFDGGVLEGRLPRPQEVPMPRRDPKLERLAAIALFRACPERELRRLARLTTELHAARGGVLCREGETGREWFVIHDGEAIVTIAGEEVARLGPGDFFGELALLDGEPRTATVTAATDLRLFVMSRPEFDELLTRVPQVSRRILGALASRLRASDARLALTA